MVRPSTPLSIVSLSSASSSAEEELARDKDDGDNDNWAGNQNNDDVIELSSGSAKSSSDEEENANDSSSLSSYKSNAASKASTISNRDDDELKFVGELRELQNSISVKLNQFEKRVRRKRRLEDSRSTSNIIGITSTQNGHASCSYGDQSEQGPSRSTWQSAVRESLTGVAAQVRSTNNDNEEGVVRNGSLNPSQDFDQEKMELEQKLAMVTQELSLSRTKQVNKLRRSAVREQMVIDVPEYSMEFYDYANVNPIKHVRKPEDWFCHFNKHPEVQKRPPEYHSWIQNRINEFLPSVLTIMCNKTGNPNQLTGSDLLSCRLVCKIWKQSIDKFLQANSVHFSDNFGCNNRINISTKVSSTDYPKFVNMVCSLVKNNDEQKQKLQLLPSRDLTIDAPLKIIDTTHAFKYAIDAFLDLVGGDVQSFTYKSYEDTSIFFNGSSVLNSWMSVRNWLTKMPNVKALRLSFFMSSPESAWPPTISLADVKSIMTSHQFPYLANLDIIECRRAPRILMESMLIANPQVHKLRILPVSDERHVQWTDCNQLNMSEIALHVSNLTQILPLRNVIWPLRNLTLSTVGVREELVDVGGLFKTLENFQRTLTKLSLNLWVGSSERCLSLRLPHLQHLDVCFRENFSGLKISYDFLLPLTALQSLKIILERECNPHEMSVRGERNVIQVIQLKGYINRLYESNMWEIFPYLKNVDATAYYGEDDMPRRFKYSRERLSK